jgi:competence protein ComEC
VTDEHGYLALRPGRGDRFIREVWTERYGASKVAWPASGEEAIGLRCDSDGCMLDRNGQRVLIAFTTTALAEDCGNADATVSLKAAYAFCEGTEVVDRIDLRRRGAVAIWLTPDGIRTRFAADGMGERNWVGTARGLRRTNDQPAPADASGVSTVSVDLPDGPAP